MESLEKWMGDWDVQRYLASAAFVLYIYVKVISPHHEKIIMNVGTNWMLQTEKMESLFWRTRVKNRKSLIGKELKLKRTRDQLSSFSKRETDLVATDIAFQSSGTIGQSSFCGRIPNTPMYNIFIRVCSISLTKARTFFLSNVLYLSTFGAISKVRNTGILSSASLTLRSCRWYWRAWCLRSQAQLCLAVISLHATKCLRHPLSLVRVANLPLSPISHKLQCWFCRQLGEGFM